MAFASVFKHILHVNGDARIVKSPQIVESADGVVSIFVDVKPYKRFLHRCPICGRKCPVYDSLHAPDRTWRALDCGGVLVYLRYRPPRVECPEHGVVTSAVPWAFSQSHFCKAFDLQVTWLAKCMPRSTIQTLMRIDWKTVGRCVDRAQKHLDPDADTRRLDGLVRIGVDETSYRKGHKYMTVVVNHDTGEVVWVHENHGKSVFEKFFEALTPEQRASIKYITGDGARWIDECIAKYAPQAVRCVDPFHVVQWVGDTLDSVRTRIWQAVRAEAREISNQMQSCTDDTELNKLKDAHSAVEAQAKTIKKSAYALGKAPGNLTPAQEARLALIADTNPALYRCYNLKEEIRKILKLPFDQAQICLKKWYWRASHSRDAEVKELAKKIKRHQDNILNTIKHGLSNARIEATNTKIKLLVRRSYGFRNLQNMFSFVMLLCSNVKIPLPNRPRLV